MENRKQCLTLKQFWSAAVLALLLAGSNSWAQGRCEPYLAEIFAPRFESAHLQEVSREQAPYGDVIVLERKTYQKKRFLITSVTTLREWSDFNAATDKAGDVRWASDSLPTALKQVFGFKTVDVNGRPTQAMAPQTHFVHVPTAATVRATLSVLSSHIREKMGHVHFNLTNFYQTSGEVMSGKTYLERFANKGELPISREGHLFEHDLNYHVLSGLVQPSSLTMALRRRVSVFLGFLKFVEVRGHHSESYASLGRQLEDVVLPEVVDRVDISTGNLARVILRGNLDKDMDIMMENLNESLEIAFMGHKSPEEYLENLISKAQISNLRFEALKEYRRHIQDSYFESDLTASWLRNPGELYNQGREHLNLLDRAAADLLKQAR